MNCNYDVIVYISGEVRTIRSLTYIQMLDITNILYQLHIKYFVKEKEECDMT